MSNSIMKNVPANTDDLSVTWHTLSAEEALKRLESPEAQGLTTAERNAG